MNLLATTLRSLAAALTVALAACSRAPAPPRAPATPRLAVLSPALAVTLRDLGLQDRIVARHASDIVLDRSVPIGGEQFNIDYETLLRVHPTHVLLQWGSRDLPPRLTDLAGRLGWTVRSYPSLTLDDIEHTTDELGRDFLPPDQQGRREALLARLRVAWSRRPGLAGAGRVMLITGTNPVIAVVGPGSFHQQVLERLGATPAIAQGAPWMELDAEDVTRRAPDAIIIISPRDPAAPQRAAPPAWEDLAARLGPLARLSIPAVIARRVALIDDPLALLPSTALASFADDLARILEGWSAAPSAAPQDAGPPPVIPSRN